MRVVIFFICSLKLVSKRGKVLPMKREIQVAKVNVNSTKDFKSLRNWSFYKKTLVLDELVFNV